MDMLPTYHHALDSPSWSNSPIDVNPWDGPSEEGQRLPWWLLASQALVMFFRLGTSYFSASNRHFE